MISRERKEMKSGAWFSARSRYWRERGEGERQLL
jgi:hypothetical protein